MTLQLLHSEFPYIWGKFDFLFYQCTLNFNFLSFGCKQRGLLKYEMILTRELLEHDWFIPKGIWRILDSKALVDFFHRQISCLTGSTINTTTHKYIFKLLLHKAFIYYSVTASWRCWKLGGRRQESTNHTNVRCGSLHCTLLACLTFTENLYPCLTAFSIYFFTSAARV